MRVLIAGGGLVGLTLARLLGRRGMAPVVLERMSAGGYVKRGFMLGHHGYGALEDLGLLEEILRRGRPFGDLPGGGSAAVAVEVGLLLQRLADGVEVRHEHTVADLLRDPSGRVTGVTAHGPAGASEIPADLVVACDGVRSRVREMAGLEAEFAPMEEGKIEWMSPVPVAEPFAMAYLADGSHIGMLSWPEGSFGWRTMDRSGREAAVAPGIEAFAEQWSRLLPAAADGVRALTSTDQLFYSEPELLSCPRWWRPGAVLIGDSAHFFGPETGVSAGIGLGDALALAQAIAANPDDPDAACAAYVTWREPAVRPLEAADPSRQRLRGTPLPPPHPEERWPPAPA
ncbi:FAD-dependent monooxygenase [Miltoncostaea marina]|uniref:FAD-dependent monooxygenase n=1 Tax=Miltoncostaea marina TaxID=2843215 RepID=UPI001C3D512A|nr:FAD-dependent monooxygenase [Miltoncostaea marina]